MNSQRRWIIILSIAFSFILAGQIQAEPILDFDTPLPPELRKQPLITVDDNIAVPCPENCAIKIAPILGGELGHIGVVGQQQDEPVIHFIVNNDSATHVLALTYTVYDHTGGFVAFQRLTPKVKVGSTPIDISAGQMKAAGLYRLVYEAKDGMSGRLLAEGSRWYSVVPNVDALQALAAGFADKFASLHADSLTLSDVQRLKASDQENVPGLVMSFNDASALNTVQSHGLHHRIQHVLVTMDESSTAHRWRASRWQSFQNDWFVAGGAATMTPITPMNPFVLAGDEHSGSVNTEQTASVIRSLLQQQTAGITPRVTWPHTPVQFDPESVWQPTTDALAYTTWYDNVARAAFVGSLSTRADAFVHVYLREGVPVLVAGTNAGEQQIALPDVSSQSVRVDSMLGTQRHEPTRNNILALRLGPEPVYVHDPGLATVGRVIIDHLTPRMQQLAQAYAPGLADNGDGITASLRHFATALWLSDVNGAQRGEAIQMWNTLLQHYMEIGYEMFRTPEAVSAQFWAGVGEFYRLLPVIAELGEAAGVTTGRTEERVVTDEFIAQTLQAVTEWQKERGGEAREVALLLRSVFNWYEQAASDSAAIVGREAILLTLNQLERFPLFAPGVHLQPANNVYEVARAVRAGQLNQTAAGWDTMPLDVTVVNMMDDDAVVTLFLDVPDGWFWAQGSRFVSEDGGAELDVTKQTAMPANVSIAVPFRAAPGSYEIPVRLMTSGLLSDTMIVTVKVP